MATTIRFSEAVTGHRMPRGSTRYSRHLYAWVRSPEEISREEKILKRESLGSKSRRIFLSEEESKVQSEGLNSRGISFDEKENLKYIGDRKLRSDRGHALDLPSSPQNSFSAFCTMVTPLWPLALKTFLAIVAMMVLGASGTFLHQTGGFTTKGLRTSCDVQQTGVRVPEQCSLLEFIVESHDAVALPSPTFASGGQNKDAVALLAVSLYDSGQIQDAEVPQPFVFCGDICHRAISFVSFVDNSENKNVLTHIVEFVSAFFFFSYCFFAVLFLCGREEVLPLCVHISRFYVLTLVWLAPVCVLAIFVMFCLRLMALNVLLPRDDDPYFVTAAGLEDVRAVEYAFAHMSERRAIAWLRNRWRGFTRWRMRRLSVIMTMPIPLELVYERIMNGRKSKALKTIRANRLPDDDLLKFASDLRSTDSNRDYNRFYLRKLVRGEIDEVWLLGHTRYGDRVWNFPSYCDSHTFERFLKVVVANPHEWRDLFLRGRLTRPQLFAASHLFDRLMCDYDSMAIADFKLLRIGGAVIGILNAVRNKDYVGFAALLATMSDVLGDFSALYGISTLDDVTNAFDLASEGDDEMEVTMLMEGDFDYLPKSVRFSSQFRAVVSLCSAICASTFFRSTTVVKTLVESCDWSTVNSNVGIAACVAVALKELTLGLQAVFAAEGDWVTRASKFFTPPKWTVAVDRGNDLLRPSKHLLTRNEICERINDIDAILSSVATETHVELTSLKTKLRDLKHSLQERLSREVDRSIPMIIWLYGEPGTGKTTLINGFVGMLDRLDGVETSPGSVINVNVHDKYPASAGLNPEARYIVMNDVPSDYTNFPNQDKAPLDLLLQQMIDSNVFYFRGAAIEDKGVALTGIKYVIVTTNHSCFKMVDDTAKLLRRFKGAACYDMTYSNRDKPDCTDLKCTVLQVKCVDKHLKFESAGISYTRSEMIRDVLRKKAAYDIMEKDRLAKFGLTADRCACGSTVANHVEKGKVVRLTDLCDVVAEQPDDVLVKLDPKVEGSVAGSVVIIVDTLLRGVVVFVSFLSRWNYSQEELDFRINQGPGIVIPKLGKLTPVFFIDALKNPIRNRLNVLWNVALEETIKRVMVYYVPYIAPWPLAGFPVVIIVAALIETAGYLLAMPPEARVLGFCIRWSTLWMHCVAVDLPFAIGVAFHFFFNNTVMSGLQGAVMPLLTYFLSLRVNGIDFLARAFSWAFAVLFDMMRFPILAFWFIKGLLFPSTYGVFVMCRLFSEQISFGIRYGYSYAVRLAHMRYIGDLPVGDKKLRDFPKAYAYACDIYARCSELREWLIQHSTTLSYLLGGALLAALSVYVMTRKHVDMQGPAPSIFAKDVNPESMRTAVPSVTQNLTGLESNRVWSQRSSEIYKLERDTKGVGAVDLAQLCAKATVHCEMWRSFLLDDFVQQVNVNVFFLGPDIVCFNAHYLYRVVKEGCQWCDKFSFKIDGVTNWYAFGDVTFDDETELVFVKNLWVKTRVPLTKFLPKEDTAQTVDASILLPHKAVTGPAFRHVFTEPKTRKEYDCWTIRGEVANGDCSSPCITTGGDSCLIGLLCAESRSSFFSVSYASVARLNQRIVERVLTKWNIPIITSVNMTWLDEFVKVNDLSVKSEFRNVSSPFLAYIGSKGQATRKFSSKFQKTRMFDDVSPMLTKEYAWPRELRGAVGDGEWSSAVMTTFKNVNLMDNSTLELKRRAMLQYVSDCVRNKKDTRLDAISLEEAIFGKPEIGIDRVVFKTSVGSRLKKNGIANKYDLFDPCEGCLVFNEEVRKDIEQMLEDSQNGVISPLRVDMTPKDEIRPKDKLAVYKVRLFSVVDFVYNITLRMLVMPVITFLLSNRFDSCVMGYMNAGSLEWGKLAEWIVEPGGKVFDMDFSSFDTSHSGPMMMVASEFLYLVALELRYSQRWADALYVVLCALTLQIVAYLDDVIVKLKGMPSGVTVTLIMNSIINAILLRMAFIVLVPDVPLAQFRHHVHEAIVGDDNLVGISDTVAARFNAVTIFELYRSWGYVATPASKGELLLPYSTIFDQTFLKRRFRFDDKEQTWFAPIDEDSIWKALCFQRKDAEVTPSDRLIQVGENAQREFFLYGRDTFHIKREQLFALYEKHGLRMRRLDYDSLLIEYKSGQFRTEDL